MAARFSRRADSMPGADDRYAPSLLISRPDRLTRFDLQFMAAFDISRESRLDDLCSFLRNFKPPLIEQRATLTIPFSDICI